MWEAAHELNELVVHELVLLACIEGAEVGGDGVCHIVHAVCIDRDRKHGRFVREGGWAVRGSGGGGGGGGGRGCMRRVGGGIGGGGEERAAGGSRLRRFLGWDRR